MKRKIELGTAIFLVIASMIVSCLGTYIYVSNKIPGLISTGNLYNQLKKVSDTVKIRYVGEYDENAAMDGLLEGYVSSLDNYSHFLTKTQYENYKKQSEGKYSGIGITVKYVSSTGLIKITRVKKHFPAENVGIKVSDIISKIDLKSVADLSYSEATDMLKGESGKEIRLEILREDSVLNFKVTLGDFLTTSIEYDLLYDDVGYIKITEFDTNTYTDFKAAYDDLIKKGAKSLIFDVRNNTGGLLDTVCKTLDMILPEGNIVTIKDKNGEEQKISSDKNEINMPMAVLINDQTYSGGELFAAAIRDYKKGKLVGVTTYGKGKAQETISLGDGTALYLSTKLYYPPNGENYEGIGVSPDIESKLSAEKEDRFYELKVKEDTQLVDALKLLGKKIK